MNARVRALLGPNASEYSHNQTIAALTLAGVTDPLAVLTDPTLVMPAMVHIERSPLLAAPWQPQPLDYQPDVAAWGVGTQL